MCSLDGNMGSSVGNNAATPKKERREAKTKRTAKKAFSAATTDGLFFDNMKILQHAADRPYTYYSAT